MSSNSPWRKVSYNPAIFKTKNRPPYNVPSAQTSSWTKKEVRFYKNWQGDDGNKLTREDYRQFLIDLNTEFDMEDAFSKIESGLQAFGTIAACMKQFPNYDLYKDTEEMYIDEECTVYKDFIKCGISFLENYKVKNNESETENKIEIPIIDKIKVEVTDVEVKEVNVKDVEVMDVEVKDVEKIQFSSDATVVETSLVNSYMAPNNITMEDLSQVTTLDNISSHQTPPPSQMMNKGDKPKKKGKMERRRKRLLKFHEKLVKTSGLPPSRLMERERLIGKNLVSDFEQLAGVGKEPAHEPFLDARSGPESGTSPPTVPPPLMPGQAGGVQPQIPAAPPGHVGQPLGQMAGSTSGNAYSTLIPTPQFFNGTTNGTLGWSEARPIEASTWEGNTFLSPGPLNWSTSGSLNLPTLSPPSQSRAWSALVPPYQPHSTPVPQAGSPAYCFHCMQYGAVFTITPV